MATPRADTQLTAEQFAEHPLRERSELIFGQLVEVPMPGYAHGNVAANVVAVLKPFARDHGLGNVVQEVDLLLARSPDLVRRPDVCFFSTDRATRASAEEGPLTVFPELAVEVVSPHDRLVDVEEKVAQHLEAGVSQVWVLNPSRRHVFVYRPAGAPMQILGATHTLDASDAIPGLHLRVADLFE